MKSNTFTTKFILCFSDLYIGSLQTSQPNTFSVSVILILEVYLQTLRWNGEAAAIQSANSNSNYSCNIIGRYRHLFGENYIIKKNQY